MDLYHNTSTRRSSAQAAIAQTYKFLRARDSNILSGAESRWFGTVTRWPLVETNDNDDINQVIPNLFVQMTSGGGRIIKRIQEASANTVTYTVTVDGATIVNRTMNVTSGSNSLPVELADGSTITAYQTKPWRFAASDEFDSFIFACELSYWPLATASE